MQIRSTTEQSLGAVIDAGRVARDRLDAENVQERGVESWPRSARGRTRLETAGELNQVGDLDRLAALVEDAVRE